MSNQHSRPRGSGITWLPVQPKKKTHKVNIKRQDFIDADRAVAQHSIRFVRSMLVNNNLDSRHYTNFGGSTNTMWQMCGMSMRRKNHLYGKDYYGYSNGKKCINAVDCTREELQMLLLENFAYMNECFQLLPVIKTSHYKGMFFESPYWSPAFELPEIMNCMTEFSDVFLVCVHTKYAEFQRQRQDILNDAGSNLYACPSESVSDYQLDWPGECPTDLHAPGTLHDFAEDGDADELFRLFETM